MTLDKDVVSLDPSPSASELFSRLRDQLVFIESHVSPHVIPDLYSLINKELDRLLLTEARMCVCVCMYTCVCVYMYMYMYVCMYVCMSVCVHVCMCACVVLKNVGSVK